MACAQHAAESRPIACVAASSPVTPVALAQPFDGTPFELVSL